MHGHRYLGQRASYSRCRSLNSVLCHLIEVPDMNLAIQVAIQSHQVVEFSYIPLASFLAQHSAIQVPARLHAPPSHEYRLHGARFLARGTSCSILLRFGRITTRRASPHRLATRSKWAYLIGWSNTWAAFSITDSAGNVFDPQIIYTVHVGRTSSTSSRRHRYYMRGITNTSVSLGL